MPARLPVLRIRFFRTAEGREPVREWLKNLPADERKAIGDDIRGRSVPAARIHQEVATDAAG